MIRHKTGWADPGSGDPGSGDPGSGDPGWADPGWADPGWADPVGLLRDPLMTALRRARARQRARHAVAEASSGRLADLTDREVQILQLVAVGRTKSAIARAPDVSPRTIAKHLERIYRKLDVTSRAAAVYHATTRSGR